MDDYTLAKRLFNGKNGSDNTSGSALSSTVTTFEAVALTDSVDGYVTIDMGGMVTSGDNNQGVTVPTTVVVKKGQTVIVQNSGGSLVVIGVVGGEDGLKQDIEKDVVDIVYEKGEEIKQQVEEDLKPLKDSFEDFKENHKLTDADINKLVTDTETELGVKIEGAIQTAEEAYTASSEAKVTVEGLETTVSENYEHFTQGMIDLESKITQTSESIDIKVQSGVESAVNSAKEYTDSAITVKADEIATTVEENVTNSLGETFATKSYVSQTAEAIETTFTASINDVKGKADNAYNKADAAEDGVNEISTYIRQSAKGIEVGRSSGTYKALVNSSGSFDVLDSSNNTLFQLRSLSGQANLYTGGYGISLTNSGYSHFIMERTGGIEIGLNNASVKLQNGSRGSFYKTTDAASYLVGATLLYGNSSGSTGTIYLDQDASDFAMIDIVVGSSRYNTVRVYRPAGSLVCLSQLVFGNSGSTMYINTEVVSVSGSTISRGYKNTYCGQANIGDGVSPDTYGNSPLSIKYVIGWKC